MQEYGWYHPSMGYWQTTGYPEPDLIDAYPEGTFSVPAKPAGNSKFDADLKIWVPATDDPADRIAAVKSECRRRIYSVVSPEAQINISGAAALSASKGGEDRTDDDAALLSAFAALAAWIADMRQAVAVIAATEALDPAADGSWPSCPETVVALAARY